MSLVSIILAVQLINSPQNRFSKFSPLSVPGGMERFIPTIKHDSRRESKISTKPASRGGETATPLPARKLGF